MNERPAVLLGPDLPNTTRASGLGRRDPPRSPIRLSALVLAHDEEARLADCLSRLGFCDETVVVLDRCRDRSREIALRFTDRVIEGAWALEGPRRRAGVEACRGEWILEVDADERVSPDLASEILDTLRQSRFDYHRIPFDNYVGDRLVRYGWGAQFGVGSKGCLFRKGVKDWADQRVHPKVIWKPGARQGPPLRHRMIHHIDRNISDMIQRLDRYSTARAHDLRESGDIGSAFHNYRRIASRFWRCFVTRKGYREGGLGFLIAVCAALYPILSYLKARYAED
ncbi:MAG: glycosyltransferase family 2 protein [Kiloniellaceae bacterium]